MGNGNPIAQDAESPPKLSYWHVWADEDGVTHQTRCEISNFTMQSMGGRAAPQWNAPVFEGKTSILFCVLPVGWVGDWHENPKPQWIVPLSGSWFVETTDGVRVEMGPGEFSFGGDQNAKEDAQGRTGHRSGTVGDAPAAMVVVQLEDPALVGARPGSFKRGVFKLGGSKPASSR